VVAETPPDNDGRLLAYVQPRDGRSPTVEDLRAALAAWLPEYAIPSTFVILDRLPLTDSGKPDRAALPQPSSERPALTEPYARPRDPIEEAIAAIWREVLGIDRVGVYDAFLALGGDSLKGTRVASRLSRTLGVDVRLGELLEASTIARIASIVRAANTHGRPAGLIP